MFRTLTPLAQGRNGSYRLLPFVKEWFPTPSTTLNVLSTRNVQSTHIIYAKAKGAVSKHKLHSQNKLQQLVIEDAHYIEKHKTAVLRVFPNVKSTVKNMFDNLSNNMNTAYRCEPKIAALGRIKNQLVFQCSLSITWPKSVTFHGYGSNKKNAELSAFTKAAEMLYRDEHMTENGYPVTVSEEERKNLMSELNRPPTITVPSSVMEEGWCLMDQYDKEIHPLMKKDTPSALQNLPVSMDEEYEEETAFKLKSFAKDDDTLGDSSISAERSNGQSTKDLLTGRMLDSYSGDNEYRNAFLLTKLKQQMRQYKGTRESPTLPILDYRDSIEDILREKRLLIVSGDTGCGKSTQVPQMIFDQWIQEGNGAECNILVTQPRRISAVALAKRVAQERNEKVGQSVGYQVRFQSCRIRDRGGIMFCTTGMLLQNLHFNPNLEGVSHVIVDEVHERSVQTDLLLILLRRVMRRQPQLRLLLMSASLSTDELQRYFGHDEAGLMRVPGTLFPLSRYFLPQALKTLSINPRKYSLEPLMNPENYLNSAVNTKLVVDVIKAIEYSKPPGAILCFLPGWQDISQVQTRLSEDARLKSRLWVLPLHSRLTLDDQELIFKNSPDDRRKVVLATNIAETSLTVNDVVYVIDTGFHKEQRYNSQKEVTVLGNHWISQANSQQRAGRAGRVQAGEVFHLYSSEVHSDMDPFPLPEIMKIPLEQVILQCKAHCGEESVRSFLSEGLSVPSRRLISAAVTSLQKLRMLEVDVHHNTEDLTSLGHRVLHFSTPPQLSKALVYASIFRCVDAALAISAVMTGGRGIFFNSLDHRSKTRKSKLSADPNSDLLAMWNIIKKWHECEGYRDALDFCNDHNLNNKSLRFNEGLKNVYGNHLYDALLVTDRSSELHLSPWSAHSGNNQLILGMLLAGVDRVLHIHRGTYTRGIIDPDSFTITTEKGAFISTTSDCVLHQLPHETSPSDPLPRHLLCAHLSRDGVSRRTVARDLSLLHPLTVLLFAGRSIVVSKGDEEGCYISVDGKNQLSFHANERTASFLMKLREVVQQVVDHEIETRGLNVSIPLVQNFCDKVVQYVNNILNISER
ncbi:hypothetical protein Pcinc_006676 [Petrolisthes cinctipes]|uniref:RNA helicase n=1 Tax=Petrolisthes cinctipes TaxID=88211 RepID=A0AAE1KXS2_PETCI|nr:hypothetical protein Pcinc_006676 [Petrolisthes cinctipes]